jgi:hypothetical protein
MTFPPIGARQDQSIPETTSFPRPLYSSDHFIRMTTAAASKAATSPAEKRSTQGTTMQAARQLFEA